MSNCDRTNSLLRHGDSRPSVSPARLRFASIPVNWYHQLMRITAAVISFTILALMSSRAGAVTCEDVASLDITENENGLLLMIYGCEPVNSQLLLEKWDSFSDAGKAYAQIVYQIPGKHQSNEQEILQLISDGDSYLKRVLAQLYSGDSNDFMTIWEEILESHAEPASDVEAARNIYFGYGSEIEVSMESLASTASAVGVTI